MAWDAFAGAIALCATAALALAAYRASRRGASPFAVALCATFAGVALLESFGVRAQVAAWMLLALYLLLLDLDSPWVWCAVPVAALWSNLHASATLAPFVAAAAAAGAALDERAFGPRARRLSAVAAAAALAICCNPFGWQLPAYAFALVQSPIKAYIVEWSVTSLSTWAFTYGTLPLLLIAAYAGTRSTRRAADAVVFAAFALLMLGAARNIALFGIAASPIAALALSRTVPWFAERRSTDALPPRLAWTLPAISLAVAIGVAVVLLRSTERSQETLATPALAALARQPGPHRVLCGDFAWCGLLVGAPGVSVFLDGRADPFPPEVWNELISIERLEDGWRAKLAARRVNAVVVARGTALDQALERTAPWRAIFSDAKYRLWVLPSAGVGFGAGHQPQRSRREFLSARRVLARVPGVARIGVVLGETLEQPDIESFVHLGARRVPALGKLAREQLAAVERFRGAVVREGFLRAALLERRVAVRDVRGEAPHVDDRILQVDRDVAARGEVALDVAVADDGRNRLANVARRGAQALRRELRVRVGPKDFAQLAPGR